MNNNSEDLPSNKNLIQGKDLERYFDVQRTLDEFARLFDYNESNDRAIAIIGVSFLEDLLEHILINFFVDDEKEVNKLLKPERPLGTFGGRTSAAYCLGLINATVRQDLRLVGKIRNRFAHDIFASFDDQKIRSWCLELKWHKISLFAEPPPNATSRQLFQVGVNQLVNNLHGVLSIARSESRTIQKI